MPIRLLAVVGAMLVVVVASQVVSQLRSASKPARPAPVAVDPLTPTVGDLDAGGVSGGAAEQGDVAAGAASDAGATDIGRIKADIEFWSSRVARDRDDFISSNRWGVSEIELARATGDLTAFLKANAAFDTTLARDQHNDAALGYKGSVLVSLHRFVDAAALARTILARQPNDPVALATLGDASLELGDLATARDAYADANAAARSAATVVRLGHLAYINGNTADALELAKVAVALAHSEGAEGERAAFYHYQLADVLISTGDRAKAGTEYAAALAANPGSFLAHAGLARFAAANGDLDGAIRQLSSAIAIVPQPDFLSRRGDLYTLRGAGGDARRAAADYATVEAIAKLAGEAAGVYDRTLAIYLANHGLEPTRAVALADAELVVRKDVYGYDADAWALLAAGRLSDADAMMARALAFGTKDAKLLYHAGMIATALHQTDRARTLLGESLALDSSFDPLQVARARATLATLH
ncbi:MAG: tetratricopeptide repeat protein [Chloroflexota bacterium]